jgi:hypothetical protein
MTVEDTIKASLRKLGIYAAGEVPTPAELADGLSSLQNMLRMWSSKKINLNATVSETKVLTAGQALYTWGISAGNIATVRPYEIVNAFVRDSSNTDSNIVSVTKGQYNDQATKYIQGKPGFLYYNPLFPLGYLYLYPVPDVAYTLYIDTIKPLTETGSFDVLASTIQLPPDYEEAIIYNLAIRVAPEYGKSVPAEVAVIAETSYNTMINLNANNQVETVSANLPYNNVNCRYDINQG